MKIEQDGGRLRLTSSLGLVWSGTAQGGTIRLVRRFASIDEVRSSLPEQVRRNLVGAEFKIEATVGGPDTIQADFIDPSVGVRYNEQTFEITALGERRIPVTLTRDRTPIANSALQYHEQVVPVTASDIPATISRITCSDPKVNVVKFAKRNASQVDVTVYAEADAKDEPIDVTLVGTDGSKRIKFNAFRVKPVAAAITVLERFNPSPSDTSFDEFDFDVSVRMMTYDPGADTSSSESYKPLSGCKVNLAVRGSSVGSVVGAGTDMDRLGTATGSTATTDSTGRVFAKVRARLGRGEIVLDVYVGDAGIGTTAGQASVYRDAPFPAVGSSIDSSLVFPDPPDGNLVDLNFRRRAAGMQEVKGQTFSERLATGAKESVTSLVFTAITYTGVDIDPTYQLIRLCVRLAKSGFANTRDLTALGFTTEETREVLAAAEKFRRQIGSLLQDDEETIAKAIYGGFLLGGVKGSVSAGFDQTIGLITDLGTWLENYVAYARANPVEALTRAGKTYLTVVLWTNPVTAPVMAARKAAGFAVTGIKWLFSIEEEVEKAVEKIDPVAFTSFLMNAYQGFYQAGGSGVDLAPTVKKLIAQGVIAHFQAASFVFETAGGVLPGLGEGLESYAKQLKIDTNLNSNNYKLFTGAYLLGMGASYVVTFIGIEVITFIVTDGVGTYVKGVVALRRAQQLWQGLEVVSTITALVDLYNAITDEPGSDEFLAGCGEGTLSLYGLDRSRAAQMLIAVFYVASEFLDRPAKLVEIAQNLVRPANSAQAGKVLKKLITTFRKEGLRTSVGGELTDEGARIVKKLADQLAGISTARLENWATVMEDLLYGWARRASRVPGADPAQLSKVSEGVFRALLKRDPAEVDRFLNAFARLSDSNPEFMNSVLDMAREMAFEASYARRLARNPGFNPNTLTGQDFSFDTVADLILEIDRKGTRIPSGARLNYGVHEFAEYLDDLRPSVNDLSLTAAQRRSLNTMLDRQIAEIKKELHQVQVPSEAARRRMRRQFEGEGEPLNRKDNVIAEWERQSGLPWPTYEKTIFRLPNRTSGGKRVLCTFNGTTFVPIYPDEVPQIPAGLADRLRNGTLDLSTTEARAEWIFRVGQDKGPFKSLGSFEPSLLDAHHVVELELGGRNEWWNIVPLLSPYHHQGGVHGADSPLRQLLEMGNVGDIIRLFGK